MWKEGVVGWKSYFALILLWVRIWFSVILEGESWFKKTTERQGASQGFQVERRLLNICSGVPDRVRYTPHFTPCWLPHPTDVKDQRNRIVFLQKKKKNLTEQSSYQALLELFQAYQKILSLKKFFNSPEKAWGEGLRLTLWQPWVTALLPCWEIEVALNLPPISNTVYLPSSYGNCQNHNLWDFLYLVL